MEPTLLVAAVLLAGSGCVLYVKHRTKAMDPEEQWRILREWGQRTSLDITREQAKGEVR